jgi:hypothetical protein
MRFFIAETIRWICFLVAVVATVALGVTGVRRVVLASYGTVEYWFKFVAGYISTEGALVVLIVACIATFKWSCKLAPPK